ncbi:hypothetical protein [Nocardiopsis trehalosi]|uniref:hypothetical protein n=1 Tax=Nocardiopsis trehalosi TaxID=109329 RepID=UPI00083512FB|nr:hypothetical protein [Nocardiopsis trehalosi]
MTPGPPAAPPADRGVLVGVDLAGIQRFVFEGRRLLDAIGRATLVADLTDTARPHLRDLLHTTAPGGHRVLRDAGGALYVAFTAPDPADAAARARAFTGRYTRRLRDLSDRLTPVVAHVPYGGPGAPATQAEALRLLPVALQEARSRLTAAHLPVLGLGVTAVCDVTGRPAELLDHTRDRGPVRERVARDVVAARVRARRWHHANSRAWLRGVDPPFGFDHLELPTDVDHLGREIGDISRLAVIHLDFNGLGDLLKRYHQACSDRGDDVVAAMRRVSADIARLTEGLARAVIRSVACAITADGPGGEPVIAGPGGAGRLRPRTERGTVYVPVRPVVVAGDDLTIICDARLAWSVTRFALSWLDTDPAAIAPGDPRSAMASRAGEEPWGRRVGATGVVTGVPSAGVGIAVQPVGAPLAVGYDICAALCDRAKEHRKEAAERLDDHVVAWSHVFDDPARVLARLEEAREPRGDAGAARTTLPMTGAELHAFLRDYLDPGAPRGLRAPAMAGQRSWLLSRLGPLLHDGHDPGPELARRRDLGVPVHLPEPLTPAALLDALPLLDLHLDPTLPDPPPPPPE